MSKMKSIREIEMERAAQPNFGKGISVASGFDLGAKAPLDSRLTVKTIEERNAHVTGNRAYEGMLVYVEADKKTYQLVDGQWKVFGFDNDQFEANVEDTLESDSQTTALSAKQGKVLKGMIDAQSSQLSTVDGKVNANAQSITQLDSKLTAEVSRATAAEGALGSRIDGVEASVEEVRSSVDTKTAQTLKDAKAYTDEKVVEINAAYKAADVQTLESAKSYADTKIGEAKTALEGSIATVDGKVSANESAISDLRDAISNKNSNTIVVETEAEIATANSNPKVGDLAYVISSKRAYIYKGVEAIAVKSVPQGWVVFDEITSELDLVNYLKKDEAEATYRKLSVKIAESDLASELSTKINNKADKSYVDTQLEGKTTEAYVNSKVEEVVAPVRTESAQNKLDITQEVQNRTAEIARVEGVITSKVESAKQELTSSLTEKEAALKAEDTKLNNRINKFVPVVSNEEPVDTEAGHVWLELV